MRPKLLLSVVVLAMCGAVVVAGIADASGRAKTTVTIHVENGDFSGKVKSPRLHRCADNRRVVLYKQKGRHQHPSNDQKIASDRSELHGDHGVWSTGNTGLSGGRYYARAGRKPGCRADASRTIPSDR